MLAAVLKDFNNLVLEDVPVPRPGEGEVLVVEHGLGRHQSHFALFLIILADLLLADEQPHIAGGDSRLDIEQEQLEPLEIEPTQTFDGKPQGPQGVLGTVDGDQDTQHGGISSKLEPSG